MKISKFANDMIISIEFALFLLIFVNKSFCLVS